MDLVHGDAEALPCLAGDPGKQHGGIVGIQPVQRASQAVVMQMFCPDAWTQQMLDGLGGEELRHQIQATIAEA